MTTNLDYIWRNYKSNKYMFIEEKRQCVLPGWAQLQTFRELDSKHKGDSDYCGFHILVFENKDPSDGMIWLDGKIITMNELIQFLRFESPYWFYESYFPSTKNRIVDFYKEVHG